MMKFIWLLLLPTLLFAKPKGAKVESGTADIRSMGSAMEVQASERAIIHWDEFSIHAGETMRFIQPSVDSAVLNRVASGMSQIDGLLQANGRVYLLNPNGIVIGKEGVVQTASFIASTLDFDNEDFFKNHELLFKGNSEARIVNLGKIEAIGGDVFLLGRAVVNEGLLKASEGVVGIAAADEILLKPSGLQRLFITPKQEAEKGDGGIENRGSIEALEAELRADGNVYRFAINQSGTIEALGSKEENGRIFLVADGGSAMHSGTLTAKGGTVHLLGDQVGVLEEGKIDVSGDCGGGEVLIGGDFQGKNDQIQNATLNVVMEGAEIYADALENGDGGRVIIWSDETTVMQGTVFARGGNQSGNGGFVEASGRENLSFTGLVNTMAPFGKTGELLLDPSNITISAAVTMDMLFDATTNTYNPVASVANLSDTTLQTQLDLTNVTVTTTSSFFASGNVTFETNIAWTSNNNLTVLADNIIFVNSAVTISNSADGSVIFDAIEDIRMEGSIVLDGGSVSLTVRDGAILLVTRVAAPSEILTVSGNVTLDAGGIIQLLPNVGASVLIGTTSGVVTMSCGGDLTLTGAPVTTGFAHIMTGNGTNSFNVGGNLTLEGGSASGSFVQIGRTGLSSSNLEFSVGGDVKVLGGSATDCFALIGHDRGTMLVSNITADIDLNTVGGDVQVISGMGTDAFAHIGVVNGGATSIFMVTGDVTLNKVAGEILVQAGVNDAMIGYGNTITPGLDTYVGSVLINLAGDTRILSSDTGYAGVGFLAGGTGITVQSPEVKVSSRTLTLTANDGTDAFIGFYSSDPTPSNTVAISQVNVQTRDNLILNPGLIESFTVDGSAAIGAFTETGTATAENVNIQSGSFFLNGSSGAMGSFSRVLGNNVSVLSANMSIGHTGSNPRSAEIFGSNTVLAIANLDITLNPDSFVHTTSGDLILVVDNGDPDSPDIGDGQFVINSGAELTSGNALRIFTAMRSQNTISAPLNGAAFVPGQFLINSNTEQWGEYFPDNFGGFPFTIFYKVAIPNEAHNEHGRVIAEMFQNLKTYDELLFCCQCFLYKYDKDCCDQTFHPKRMVSSFDLFSEEIEQMLRQNYRNYHTKYVESF